MTVLCVDDVEVPMKLVYQLSEEHRLDPDDVKHTQALTLNQDKPHWGLNARLGLYGSREWWQNVQAGTIPRQLISGVICRLYIAGQDETEINSFDLRTQGGSVTSESIYVNDDADLKLFRMGCRVDLVYVLLEFKEQPARDGGVNYLPSVLEMAVSLEPVQNP